MRRRWWIVLAVAFAACLALVVAQGTRPWERWPERPVVAGSGAEVEWAGVAFRVAVREVAEEFATDDEPRRALPGTQLVKVVVEQRQVAPDAGWEFCTVRLGTSDGKLWADEPEGYDRPADVPADSSCATKDEVPPPGEVHRFGKVFLIPQEYAESADVIIALPEAQLRLTR
ncbi:MAG: hypothetical protein Q4F67_13700 [Propionibacteriaceae bacterium]|nr:hypothetical protein [Propionibacteriaceae bacterium]